LKIKLLVTPALQQQGLCMKKIQLFRLFYLLPLLYSNVHNGNERKSTITDDVIFENVSNFSSKKINAFIDTIVRCIVKLNASYPRNAPLSSKKTFLSEYALPSFEYRPSPQQLLVASALTGAALYIYRGNLWITPRHIDRIFDTLKQSILGKLTTIEATLSEGDKTITTKIDTINKTINKNSTELVNLQKTMQQQSKLFLTKFGTLSTTLKSHQRSTDNTSTRLLGCTQNLYAIHTQLAAQQKQVTILCKDINTSKEIISHMGEQIETISHTMDSIQNDIETISNLKINFNSHDPHRTLPPAFEYAKLRLENNNQQK
jgi:prefoldin subunit 5